MAYHQSCENSCNYGKTLNGAINNRCGSIVAALCNLYVLSYFSKEKKEIKSFRYVNEMKRLFVN